MSEKEKNDLFEIQKLIDNFNSTYNRAIRLVE